MSTSATATVLADQLRCQLKPEILDCHLGSIGGVVLHQDESVGDGHI
jgi:hypothetical protein